jgi:hypothetical protein
MARLHIFLGTALFWLALAIFCALPTFELFGRHFGGGPIRQWIVNVFILPVMPLSLAEPIVLLFQQGPASEWAITALGLVPYTLALVPLLYAIVAGTAYLRPFLRDH